MDQTSGGNIYKGAMLAVEQINTKGGFLGRNLTIVAEDDDGETTGDIATATNALTRLIAVDKADYILASGGVNGLVYQDVCCAQKKILFLIGNVLVDLTQRVLDNYDKYKYFFRTEFYPNSTALEISHIQSLAALKATTGFTKIGYLLQDGSSVRESLVPRLDSELPKLGFQVVYHGLFAGASTVDFTSYFAQAEAANAEILFTVLTSIPKSITLVNEWYDRQSPMLLCGDIYGIPDINFWNSTSGKTEFALSRSSAVTFGYPLTSKTIPTKDAYFAKYGQQMKSGAAGAYDTIAFILSDAIARAGTTETEAVIKALETVSVDTSLTRGFRFTSNHDIYVDASDASQSSILYIVVQWQDGAQVPVFPETLRIEAGTTYKFPTWSGPWSKLTP